MLSGCIYIKIFGLITRTTVMSYLTLERFFTGEASCIFQINFQCQVETAMWLLNFECLIPMANSLFLLLPYSLYFKEVLI